LPLVFTYVRPLHPGVYEVEPRFGIEKVGAACVYPYPNMLVVVCCGISEVGAEPSMVVRLRKWFICWTDGFVRVVPPTDAPLS
jgi:hypothetical protein